MANEEGAPPAADAEAEGEGKNDPAAALNAVVACLQVCGMGDNAERFAQFHSINKISNLEIIQAEDIPGMFKNYNNSFRALDRKMGFIVEKQFKGLVSWVTDQTHCQIALVPASFTEEVLTESCKKM